MHILIVDISSVFWSIALAGRHADRNVPRSYGDSWEEAEYRLIGPNGVESAEMDAEHPLHCRVSE